MISIFKLKNLSYQKKDMTLVIIFMKNELNKIPLILLTNN